MKFLEYCAEKIDWPSFNTGVRTVGALMTGNAFVAAFILDNKHTLGMVGLGFLGITAIISTSVKQTKKAS
jgi:hypothetical protein